MDNYVISDEEQLIDADPPFPAEFVAGVRSINVTKNTKFAAVNAIVAKDFETASTRLAMFRGVGDAADKCISCVEVFKRQTKEPLYQWNQLATARRVTFWDPIDPEMDRLKVTLDTPVLYILISRDPFPVQHQSLSMQCSTDTGRGFADSGRSVGPRKTPLKKTRHNKWARPSKDAKAAMSSAQDEITKDLSKATV